MTDVSNVTLPAHKRLIVALDVDTLQEARVLAAQLAGHVGMFKIGMQLFYSAGPQSVKELRSFSNIFLDLKLHDIPNTVAKTARVLTRLGASIFNVHASGGFGMMQATAEAVKDEANHLGIEPPLVVAVTVLTSLDQKTMNEEIIIPGSIQERVAAWARLAQKAGLDGVVASPREIAAVRKACGGDFVIITPGIRPAGSSSHDQKRVMEPGEALREGATYLVVGRPVTGADDPVAAARSIVLEMDREC